MIIITHHLHILFQINAIHNNHVTISEEIVPANDSSIIQKEQTASTDKNKDGNVELQRESAGEPLQILIITIN
jgi:hypothetical protein